MGVRVTLDWKAGEMGEACIRAAAARIVGSAAPVAPASRLMERVVGLTAEQAGAITPDDLLRDLGDPLLARLPWIVGKGAAFAVEALRAALGWKGCRPADPRGPGLLVCRCLDVGDRQIRDAVRQGATTPEEVGARTQACTGCRSCRSDLLLLIGESTPARAEPPREGLPAVVRIVLARVAPLLHAHGVGIDDVGVTEDGVLLRLDARWPRPELSARGAQEIARHVLRETVCPAICVEIDDRRTRAAWA